MRFSRQLGVALAACMMAACATTGKSPRMAGLSSDAQKVVEASSAAPLIEEKASLEASLDEYRTVTLVDDETGKAKIICKRIRPMGTRFEKKVCATKEEWALMRSGAKGTTNSIQRNMNAKSLQQ